MLPLVIDLAAMPAALVGRGSAAAARLAQLDDAGARDLQVYSDAPERDLAKTAGGRLRFGMPNEGEIARSRLLFVADVDEESAERLVAIARRHRVLVHAEDRPTLTDFHMPAIVRRGDLLIAVSTGGQSPGLARRLRRFLETQFAAGWGERLARVGALRARLRASGAPPAAVAAATDRLVEEEGWLPPLRGRPRSRPAPAIAVRRVG